MGRQTSFRYAATDSKKSLYYIKEIDHPLDLLYRIDIISLVQYVIQTKALHFYFTNIQDCSKICSNYQNGLL